jgi:hypothetical protein
MLAGRSFNDLTQYPVFPWVISQFTEPTLDLHNKRTFRDLSCPIGALNPERLSMFQTRLRDIPSGEPRFLYGTHYSSPGYVIYFLVREVPDLMLKLQSGKFDAPDRLFQSIGRTWNGVVTSAGDVKELIPEFYFDESISAGQGVGSFLMNRMGLKLGARQDGQKVDNVILPPWAPTAKAYVQLNRKALESPYISSQLHSWIDLIFGAKQRGAAAEAANNLFHPLTYSHEIGIKTVSGIHDRRAVEIQIGEFGQASAFFTPILFEHPFINDVLSVPSNFLLSRTALAASTPPSWKRCTTAPWLLLQCRRRKRLSRQSIVHRFSLKKLLLPLLRPIQMLLLLPPSPPVTPLSCLAAPLCLPQNICSSSDRRHLQLARLQHTVDWPQPLVASLAAGAALLRSLPLLALGRTP